MRGYSIRLVAPMWLAACLALGGSSAGGLLVNLFLQLGSLVLIGISLASRAGTVPDLAGKKAPAIFLSICGVLLLASLVPLPPQIWSRLPGREHIVSGYLMTPSRLPWLPLSLSPGATIASALWALPGIAMLLTIIRLRAFDERWLAWTIVSAAGIGVILGALQLGDGASSSFYFYDITNIGAAVGTFANANHFATLLVSTIAFLTALYASGRDRDCSKQAASAQPVILAGALLVVAVGLVLVNSLAGLGLAMPVAAASYLMVSKRPFLRRYAPAFIALLSALSIAFVMSSPFGNNLTAADAISSQYSRYTFYVHTIKLIARAFPIGTGLGTFPEIYSTIENPLDVSTTFINHAHNDYLELVLEWGMPGLLIILSFLIWWALRARTLWTSTTATHFELAATIASGAILIHSAVDYPLRTAGIQALFAACCGLMAGHRPLGRAGRRRDRSMAPKARHLYAD
ncbi:MAG: O-antigen ligase family protein [Sphingomonadaceae bacterium]|nr:O-antigen ligase family protein [Sphingomonadaceae bacterium]